MQKNIFYLLITVFVFHFSLFACLQHSQNAPAKIEIGNLKKCYFCKATITQKYWGYENGISVCLECDQKLPKCHTCNLPCIRPIFRSNLAFCRECEKLDKCKLCEFPISGKYYRVGQNNVCKSCYTQYPKCLECAMPCKKYHRIDEKFLCPQCYGKAEKCPSCKVPIIQKFYQFALNSGKYCKDCSAPGNLCDMCSMPLTKKYFTTNDNRRICSICSKTAVTNKETVEKIITKVLFFLKNDLDMKIPMKTQVHFVSAQTLEQVRNQGSIGKHKNRAMGLFIKRKDHYDVYIENLMPYSLCLAVIAHELAHTWQAEYYPGKTELLWLEGFAEWISYKTLLYYGYKKQAKLIALQKSIYGQGFRRVLEIEKRFGTQQVFEKIVEIAK